MGLYYFIFGVFSAFYIKFRCTSIHICNIKRMKIFVVFEYYVYTSWADWPCHCRKCKRLNDMAVSKELIEGVEQKIKAEFDFL